MSYILDALRKAERDRQVSHVPTLTTMHGPAESSIRRPPWMWIGGAALVIIAACVSVFVWLRTPPAPVRASAPAAVASGAPAAGPGVDARMSPPPLATAPRDLTAGVPVPGAVGEISPARPAPPRPQVTPVVPPASPSSPARRPAGAAPPTRVVPPATTAPQLARPTLPETLPSPLPTARSSAAAPEPRVSSEPAVPPAAGPPAGASEAPADAPAASAPAQPLPRFALDVLVYSDVPIERMVFINGRKYVEGQAIDGDTVLEQITADGAILRYQGKSLVLRPKLNPYARPRSP
jgi:general secretion pathway protein B